MRRTLFSAVLLLATGGISALAISLLTSGRISGMPHGLESQLAALIAWQNLNVIIAKMGLDVYLFAASTRSSDGGLHQWPRNYLLRSLILAAAGSALAWSLGRLDGSTCAVIVFATWLDVPAIVRIAELTGRQQLRPVVIASLLRFPLFFVVLLMYLLLADSPRPAIAGAIYVVSAAARWIWVEAQMRRLPRSRPIDVGMGVTTVQQVANYLMYRGDQLIAPALLSSAQQMAQFFFLAKYAEIASLAAASAGSVIFPALVLRWENRSPRQVARECMALLTVFALVAAGLAVLYILMWKGEAPITGRLLLLAAAAAALSWPANFFTFLLMRRGRIDLVIRAAVMAVCVGLILLAGVSSPLTVGGLLCILPAALLTFVGGCAIYSRGSLTR